MTSITMIVRHGAIDDFTDRSGLSTLSKTNHDVLGEVERARQLVRFVNVISSILLDYNACVTRIFYISSYVLVVCVYIHIYRGSQFFLRISNE